MYSWLTQSHKSLTLLLGSSSAINARQNLAILSQANPMVRSPDSFFRHHKEKQKKVVWPCETSVMCVFVVCGVHVVVSE